MERYTPDTPYPDRSFYKSSDFFSSGQSMASLITAMKLSHSWARGELNAFILLKNPDKKVILTAMHGDTKITSYQSNASVTLRIIEGSLQFHSKGNAITLSTGQEMTFSQKARYSLTTSEVTVFLLTISNDIVINSGN